MHIPPPPSGLPPQGEDDSNNDCDDSFESTPEIDNELNDMNDLNDFSNMETPLVGHRSNRKGNNSYGPTEKRGKENRLNRPFVMPTCYSSIEDSNVNGETDQKDDNRKENNNLEAGEEDDRSILSVSTVMTNFREGLLLPFMSDETSLPKIATGLSSLAAIGVVLGIIMPKNSYLHGLVYPYFSSIIGYTYFVLWSVCFYPQVLMNYRRKSTRGLSHDFAILNFMGWTFYSAYLGSMFFDKKIQDLYQQRFKNEKSSVQSNDVLFAVHAMILSFVYLVQIFYYAKKSKRPRLRLKPQSWALVLAMGVPAIMVPVWIALGLLDPKVWLDYFYILSFFKICCTLTKYAKQAIFNWKRQSTKGWNIWYNFLECAGGTLSMLQILLDSWNTHDSSQITGNLAKLILGVATVLFDIIFFIQHYILYPDPLVSSEIPYTIQASDRLILNLHKSSDLDDYRTQD